MLSQGFNLSCVERLFKIALATAMGTRKETFHEHDSGR
jgi:hypothetical protein